MVVTPHQALPAVQRGSSLLEVLITLVILAIGLLGLAGLQTRLQATEMESYQRAQALVLLDDMASRIAANRNNAATYVTPAPLGTNAVCPAGTSRQQVDAREWCQALQGAGETLAGAGNVGAMVGGRGCVQALGSGEYLVTVAWQGTTPVAAPVPSCASNLYNLPVGSKCTGDRCRRVVTTVVRIGNLM
jgi:type IV pilus assembly protein PilV